MENNKDIGYVCQCCGLYVKRYRRALNANMALVLIELVKNKQTSFVHVEKFMVSKGYTRPGDFSKLTYWGFLKKKDELREDGSPRNGMYQITGRGIMFAEGKVTAPKYVLIFNNKCEGFTGGNITIDKALGKKFNYFQLMNND